MGLVILQEAGFAFGALTEVLQHRKIKQEINIDKQTEN
jgi:hypothetical protein